MSVQIIKWIILLFVTGNCLSKTCKANDTPKVCLPVQSNITIINQADNMLHAQRVFRHAQAVVRADDELGILLAQQRHVG